MVKNPNAWDSYDKASIASIYEHSLKLKNRSLSEVVELPEGITNTRDRGNLGSLVEIYYFRHKAPNDHNPDFVEAGLELKTTGVVKHKSGAYRAKERLVLGLIDFNKIVTENWDTSTFLHKCQIMLILFSKFDKEIPVIHRKFVMDPLLYSINDPDGGSHSISGFENIPASELEMIKKDWLAIQAKVISGKAHELSEGDTIYLGACRKGAGGENEALRTQPNSDTKAKARALSFKQGYLNKLIARHEGQVHELGLFKELPFDEAALRTFKPYIGKSIEELGIEFNFLKKSKNQKGYHRELALKILKSSGSSLTELQNADIELKTIRLTNRAQPREAMSFPAFDYMKILNEEWEDSKFFEKIERKFLFIIFKENNEGVESLLGTEFWNMPYEDRLEARRVWEDTKRRVAVDASDLPKSSESCVAHVRPKAADANDTAMTPQGQMLVKKCFWLNKDYIAGIVAKNIN